MVAKHSFILSTLLLISGCGLRHESSVKKIERTDARSLAWRSAKLMASPAGRLLADKAAHSPAHARAQAITLAKQVKEVEGDVSLYRAVGLSGRAQRRYKALLNYTKRRVASGALNAAQYTRT